VLYTRARVKGASLNRLQRFGISQKTIVSDTPTRRKKDRKAKSEKKKKVFIERYGGEKIKSHRMQRSQEQILKE